MTIIACLILIALALAFVAFCPRLAPAPWPAPIKTRMNKEREKGPGCGEGQGRLKVASKEDDGEWSFKVETKNGETLAGYRRAVADDPMCLGTRGDYEGRLDRLGHQVANLGVNDPNWRTHEHVQAALEARPWAEWLAMWRRDPTDTRRRVEWMIPCASRHMPFLWELSRLAAEADRAAMREYAQARKAHSLHFVRW